ETFPIGECEFAGGEDGDPILHTDFKRLQEEVSRNIEALAQLSKDVQGVVFSSIVAMLRDRENLQDL
ncbi:hypothetical protein P7K49_026713, partial [Saguinus oedipus]